MINTIKFKPELMVKIKEGKKLATTRLGIKSGYTLGPVLFIDAEKDKNQLKGASIKSIKVVKFKDLTTGLAIKEGYQFLTELQVALSNIYGPISDNDSMTVIEWTESKL